MFFLVITLFILCNFCFFSVCFTCSKKQKQKKQTQKQNNKKMVLDLKSKKKKKKKKNFAPAAHFLCTFLCRCFARLQRETSRNVLVTRFMEEISFTFFSLPLIFTLHSWPLAFLILSPPLQHKHNSLLNNNSIKKIKIVSDISHFIT